MFFQANIQRLAKEEMARSEKNFQNATFGERSTAFLVVRFNLHLYQKNVSIPHQNILNYPPPHGSDHFLVFNILDPFSTFYFKSSNYDVLYCHAVNFFTLT